jgi:hypothetical protein
MLRRTSQYGWRPPEIIWEVGKLPFSATRMDLRSKLNQAKIYLGY